MQTVLKELDALISELDEKGHTAYAKSAHRVFLRVAQHMGQDGTWQGYTGENATVDPRQSHIDEARSQVEQVCAQVASQCQQIDAMPETPDTDHAIDQMHAQINSMLGDNSRVYGFPDAGRVWESLFNNNYDPRAAADEACRNLEYR